MKEDLPACKSMNVSPAYRATRGARRVKQFAYHDDNDEPWPQLVRSTELYPPPR